MNVTAIIPCFNHESLLDGKLESLRRQTLKPSEIIVVDDGSKIPVRTSVRYKLIQHERNLGVPTACNTGILAATNELLILTALDDQITDITFIERCVEAYKKYPQAAFISTQSDIFDERTSLIWESPRIATGYYSPNEVCAMLRKNTFSAQGQSTLYRKSMFMRYGLYHPRHKWNHDLWALLIQARHHGFVALSGSSVRFNIRDGAYSRGKYRLKDQYESVLDLVLTLKQDAELFEALLEGTFFARFGRVGMCVLSDLQLPINDALRWASNKESLRSMAVRFMPKSVLSLALSKMFPKTYHKGVVA